MRCFVLASVYNEAANLPRMWESVQASVPGEVIPVLVTIDGKYPDYEDEDDLSTDGTRDYAELEGELLDCVNYECEKRSAGLAHIDSSAEEGDYVLVLDADEEITSFFGWPQRVGSIAFTRFSDDVPYGRCRLYRWEPGLHFKGRHYDLYDFDDELVASLEDAPAYEVVGAGIHHDRSHSPERMRRKRAYYKHLREREGHPSEVPV